jgi:thiamine biosynthesis protein ThiI
MTDEENRVAAIVRLSSDLATKSRPTRRRFQRVLKENLRDALESAGLACFLDDRWGRMLLRGEGAGITEAVRRVFGVASVSEIETSSEPDLEAIVSHGSAFYKERVSGRTFAVRARRMGRLPFSSQQINESLGAALAPFGRVRLEEPDVEVGVEVYGDRAFFFTTRIAGPGGLPLGVEGRAVALVSGGFDSPVAAWMAMRRGVALDFVFFNLAGAAQERQALGVIRRLVRDWCHGTRPKVHVVNFQPLVAHLQERTERRYWQVLLKRLMVRGAGRIAREIGAAALVTGESLGQVSSQTLQNLRVIGEAVELPVLRPLLGFDKTEIIARSREIGTHELSEKVREHCALVGRRPATAARAAAIASEEEKLDPKQLEEAVSKRRVLDVRALTEADLTLPYLYTTEIPPGAVVLDIRPRAEYENWHFPGAEHLEFSDLARVAGRLDRDRTYVLYCEVGLRSAHLAERMQARGIEAYSFRGGVAALRRYASGDPRAEKRESGMERTAD